MVLYPIMTSNATGERSRSANYEVFKVRDEQAKSVTAICRRVAEICRASIESGLFVDDNPQLFLVKHMVSKLRNIMQYMRRRRQTVKHTQ